METLPRYTTWAHHNSQAGHWAQGHLPPEWWLCRPTSEPPGGLTQNQIAGPSPPEHLTRSVRAEPEDRASHQRPRCRPTLGAAMSYVPPVIQALHPLALQPGGVSGECLGDTRTQAGTTHSFGHLRWWHPSGLVHGKESVTYGVGWAGKALGLLRTPFSRTLPGRRCFI